MKKGGTSAGLTLILSFMVLFSPFSVQADGCSDGPGTSTNPPALTTEIQNALSCFADHDNQTVYDLAPDSDKPDRVWDISGQFTLAGVYNISHESPDPGATDYRGFSRLRPELDLTWAAKISDNWRCRIGGKAFRDFIYTLRGYHKYTDQVVAEYESEVELTEAYVEGTLLPALDIKLGRQILVWGNTENFRITDILNPVDNRDPGMVDIEDLRLPVGMAKLSYYTGDYSLAVMAVPEIRFDKQPVPGNDFYPFDQPLPPEDKPDGGLGNTEVAMSLKGIFPGWDMTLYGAYFFNDESYLKTVGARNVVIGQAPLPDGALAPIVVQMPIYEQRHARLAMTGCAINAALGSWLLKTELAFTDGLQFNTTSDKKTRVKGLAGFEYSGLTDTLIVVELVQTHLFGYHKDMGMAPDYADENQFEAAFRISRDLLHDRLELMLLVIARGSKAQDGAFERLTAEYELSDALSVKAGCVFYQDGDDFLYDNIHDNNRLFVNLQYTF